MEGGTAGALKKQASPESVNVWEDAVGHTLTVLFPSHTVFPLTLALITGFSVDKQHGEVDHIEIRQNVLKTCREQ